MFLAEIEYCQPYSSGGVEVWMRGLEGHWLPMVVFGRDGIQAAILSRWGGGTGEGVEGALVTHGYIFGRDGVQSAILMRSSGVGIGGGVGWGSTCCDL